MIQIIKSYQLNLDDEREQAKFNLMSRPINFILNFLDLQSFLTSQISIKNRKLMLFIKNLFKI
jgi:hypothetical protein